MLCVDRNSDPREREIVAFGFRERERERERDWVLWVYKERKENWGLGD